MPAVQRAKPIAPSFETVWAAFQETDRLIKETRESQKETDRIVKETALQIQESKLEYDKRIGHLDNLFGEMAEHMIAPKLCDSFREIGLDFPRANRNIVVKDLVNNIHFEIDVMLENGDKAMLVEVKEKLTTKRIDKHLERIEKMRKYADLHGDKRTFLGAIAGIVMTNEEKKYTLEQGFYLIEPTGDNFFITSPEGKPKEW